MRIKENLFSVHFIWRGGRVKITPVKPAFLAGYWLITHAHRGSMSSGSSSKNETGAGDQLHHSPNFDLIMLVISLLAKLKPLKVLVSNFWL